MIEQEHEKGAAAEWLEDEDVWGYVQEPGRPQFKVCPSCGDTAGVWHGFRRISKAVVLRKRKCRKCGHIYTAARLESAYGEVDMWEAKWLLRWEPFYAEWLADLD